MRKGAWTDRSLMRGGESNLATHLNQLLRCLDEVNSFSAPFFEAGFSWSGRDDTSLT